VCHSHLHRRGALSILQVDKRSFFQQGGCACACIYQYLCLPTDAFEQRRSKESLRSHAPYVKLLLLAVQELMALPQFAYEGVGYRGLKLDGNAELERKYLDYKSEFVVGQLMTFPAFMSVSTDDSVADDFGDYVFFVFVKVRGARIAQLSQLPKEAEILVPPPSVFRIKAVAKVGTTKSFVGGHEVKSGGRLTVTLEQESCPLAYLSQSASKSAVAPSLVSGSATAGSVPLAFASSGGAASQQLPSAAATSAVSSLSDLSILDVALIVSSKGAAFEGYSSTIVSNSFGGDVIDMLDMDDVTQFMETMGFATNHKLLLKAIFAGWKKNPEAAFQALAAAKVSHHFVSKLSLAATLPLT
jgi:hypothetical protein